MRRCSSGTLFLREDVGKNLFINEIDISADAAQVTDGGADGGFQHPVILHNDVAPDLNLAIRMGKLYRPQGVSNQPGDPVVMQVSVVVTCEMTPASESLDSRLT